jgi:hypothetical protein
MLCPVSYLASMSSILSYLYDFFRTVDKWLLLCCAGFAAILITLNYRFGIETKWLYNINSRWIRAGGFYLVYATAFILPYLLIVLTRHKEASASWWFWILLFAAPAIFAAKVNFNGIAQWIDHSMNNVWGRYFSIIANLPSKLLVVLLPLVFLWRWQMNGDSFWGLTTRQFQWWPYLLMLLIMIPLIAFASTRADFLHAYPKVKQVAFINEHVRSSWPYKLLFETSYGIDFITIELFFRGFLVFAFVRYVGPDAILPMAVFYCSIHFGKPLFECISSFFGGMLLGIIAYRTQSILGGIVVHLGIAWMMEVGGYWGNLLKK